MVWACFSGRRKGPIRVLYGDPNVGRGGIRAVDILQLYGEVLPQLVQEDDVFMQDNARVHTAHIVRDWLQSASIETMEWPPYSPDLNPIEHVWSKLKQLIYKLYPELLNGTMSGETLRQAIITAINDAWEAIDNEFLWSLTESMERRVGAVIAANGSYTKY